MQSAFPIVNNTQYYAYAPNKTSAILVVSDWHFGMNVCNYINTYNTEVFKSRINQLISKTIDKLFLFAVEKLYVVNLSDLISGLIRNTIRLQNRENIIRQIMFVSETLAEMIEELSRYCEIEYYSVIDNHSRVVADKKDSIEEENFSILIDWFLQERFKNKDNVKINANLFGDDICKFSVYDWKYLGVHGHDDKNSNVVPNQTLMTREFFDVVLTGHSHHVSSDEDHCTYVFSNGTLIGTDAHAKKLRKASNPSQTLIVVTPDDCASDICILKLD